MVIPDASGNGEAVLERREQMTWVLTYEECTLEMLKQVKSARMDADTHTVTIEEWQQDNGTEEE